MQETDLYVAQLRNMPGVFTRIENAISSGIFDVHVAFGGRNHFVENKVPNGNLIKVRGSQYVWALRQLSAGSMKNLWFMTMKYEGDVPLLYDAQTIIDACSPSRTDKVASMLVNVKGLKTRARGWAAIVDTLFAA